MRRFASAALFALLALTVIAAPTSAGHGWCRSDPVVFIDNRIVDVWVTAPLLAPLKVTGPNQVVITTPTDVDGYLVLADLGFGRGEDVTFQTSPNLHRTANGVEVQVAVYVPSRDTSMFVGVEFAPDIVGLLAPTKASGTANQWVVLNTVLR
jgi:hypothetical protein